MPTLSELLHISYAFDVSMDYLIGKTDTPINSLSNDELQLVLNYRDGKTAEEELVLLYYKKFPKEVMELLSSFTALSDRNRKKVLGKCLDLEDEAAKQINTAPLEESSSSVAADEPEKMAK